MSKSNIYREYSPQVKQLWHKTMALLWGQERQTDWYEQTMTRILIHGTLLRRYDIQPRGVIYAGAHQGNLLWAWLALGFRNVLMIEPQPASVEALKTVARLSSGLSMVYDQLLGAEEAAQLRIAACAIGEHDGEAELFIMSFKDLTSLKKPNVHLFEVRNRDDAAPRPAREVSVVERRNVPLRTLDSLLQEYDAGQGASPFNVLYMNIQGAELDALKGATRTLERLELIYLENNYVERYQGAPTVDELDAYLGDFGFEARWGMTQPTVGNGFTAYVKNRAGATGGARGSR